MGPTLRWTITLCVAIASELAPIRAAARVADESVFIVCALPGERRLIDSMPDGEGGLYALWWDNRLGISTWGLYASRFDASGDPSPGWPADGLQVHTVDGSSGPVAAFTRQSDGDVLIAWAGALDASVLRLDASGAPASGWESGARPLSMNPPHALASWGEHSGSLAAIDRLGHLWRIDGDGGQLSIDPGYIEDPELSVGSVAVHSDGPDAILMLRALAVRWHGGLNQSTNFYRIETDGQVTSLGIWSTPDYEHYSFPTAPSGDGAGFLVVAASQENSEGGLSVETRCFASGSTRWSDGLFTPNGSRLAVALPAALVGLAGRTLQLVHFGLWEWSTQRQLRSVMREPGGTPVPGTPDSLWVIHRFGAEGAAGVTTLPIRGDRVLVGWGDRDLLYSAVGPDGALAAPFLDAPRVVADGPVQQRLLSFVPDGEGGAIALWSESQPDGQHLMGRRLGIDAVVSVRVSALEPEVGSEGVKLRWHVSELLVASVERSETGRGEWRTLGQAWPSGSDALEFVDRSPPTGQRSSYRLRLPDGSIAGVVEVDIPAVQARRLRVDAIAMGPAPVMVELTGHSADPNRLTVFDVNGRAIESHAIPAGPGRRLQILRDPHARAGIVFLRLDDPAGPQHARIALLP